MCADRPVFLDDFHAQFLGFGHGGVAAFDGVLDVADALIGKLNKTDIPSHNYSLLLLNWLASSPSTQMFSLSRKPPRPRCSQLLACSERSPKWRSIARKQQASTASRAVWAPWFTTRRSPRPQRKTWCTSSMPHSFSQPALIPSGYQSFQLSATWNPANGTSSPAGSSTLTISMSWLRQRSLLPSTLSSTRPNLSSQRTRYVRR